MVDDDDESIVQFVHKKSREVETFNLKAREREQKESKKYITSKKVEGKVKNKKD